MSIVESNYQILDTQIRSIRTEKWRKIHEQEDIREIERIEARAQHAEDELLKAFDPFAVDEERKAA